MIVPQPMYITARLEAGLKLPDGSVVSVFAIAGKDFGYRVENAEGRTLEVGRDLRSPMAEDYAGVMGALLAFLAAAGEGYAYEMRGGRKSDNTGLFNAATTEWAYQNSDELTLARMELEGDE